MHSADLDDLSVSVGTLSPAFNAATFSYDAGTVSNATDEVTVDFSTDDGGADALCQGGSVAVNNGNGNATCGAVPLIVGLNTITIEVTSQDTMTTLTTTLTITRAGTSAGIVASPFCTASDSNNTNGWYLPVGAVVTVDVFGVGFVQLTSSIFTPIDLDGATASINSKGYITYAHTVDSTLKFTVSAGTGKIIVDTPDNATATTANSDSFTVGVCAGATYSAAGSNIQVQQVADATPDKTVADDLTAAAGEADLFINMSILNGYGAGVASGIWAAQATNGALVNIGDPSEMGDAGTLPFDSYTGDGDTVHVRVSAKDAAVSQTTTVTVTYNGAAIATKNLKFLGEATKISIIANTVGANSSSGMAWFTLQDAAGNDVPGDVSVDTTTLGTVITNVASALSAEPNGQNTPNNTIGGTFDIDYLDANGKVKYGIVEFTCASSGTSGTTTLVHTNAISGDDIKLPVTFTCAGGVDTYAVSLNAASYRVGEVGTLTVTAKDKLGNPVNDFSYVTGEGNIALGGGASWVKAPADPEFYGLLGSSAAGTKTYKVQFTAGGAWNAVALMSGATTKSATTAYTVTSGGTSLEDVLKAIVSLIASINKQIAALQKALLKKK
jgi:hypothetical protein